MFNGYELTQRFVVSDLRNPLMPRTVNAISVPGMDGSAFAGAKLDPRAMTMTVTVMGRTEDELEAESRMLAAMLATEKPAPLTISNNNGLYYLAVASAPSDGVRSYNAISYDVTFTAHDPVAYGDERTITVPSGGSVTFGVGGTYRTAPTVVAPSAANCSDGYWRLTLDDADRFSLVVPDGVATSRVEGDCASRVLRIDGEVSLLDALSDWLEFEPGQHTLAMEGTGAATVTYRERWV